MGKCKVIAVANKKGDVGRTTTTMNLGVGLARHGKKVLLVDADSLIIPSQPSFFPAKGIIQLIRLVNKVKSNLILLCK